MDITRRAFLGYTAGAIGILRRPLEQLAAVKPAEQPPYRRWTVYSDPNSYNSESMQGYWSALPEAWYQSPPGEPARLALLVVPSCVSLLPAVGARIRRDLETGTTVVIETGAGFAGRNRFRRHYGWLRDRFDIRVASSIDLWANRTCARVPYIEFTWPCHARIRDFSRVVPPTERPGDDVIAWAGDLAVATRRRVGKGTLIYLGSPIGPALWAGDLEAKRWLHALAHAA